MAQSTPLDYQIRLDFLFAYDRATLIRHANGAPGRALGESPSHRLDRAALEQLIPLLAGYDMAAETWATGESPQEVIIALDHPEIRRPYWSIRFGTGNPGSDLDDFQYGTETPFKSADEVHVCCVQLVSPAFNESDEQWTDFARGIQTMLNRLQRPGSLHPPTSAEGPRINHLAWVNKTCSFTVTVRPVDDEACISWPTLQNLYAAWGSCSQEIERLQNPRHSTPTKFAFRKLAPAGEQTIAACVQRLHAVLSLAMYLNMESLIATKFCFGRD
ncbi:MAG: hypothetical protein L6R39_007609 [Caloplaca ligustica]|nr:MAG: hypothetical protein L6R39_007609 [Caloplaca ligustica]